MTEAAPTPQQGAARPLLLYEWKGPPLDRLLDVPDDEAGLRKLALQGCWRALLERARAPADAGTEASLTLAAYRILSLCKTRSYSAAAEELAALGPLDSPQYTAPGAQGCTSLVPFALRWLAAQLPGLLGRPGAAADALYALLQYCQEQRARLHGDAGGAARSEPQPQPDAGVGEARDAGAAAAACDGGAGPAAVWAARERIVAFTLVNHHVRAREYALALALCNGLLREAPACRAAWCAAGFIQLHLGDVAGATRTFQTVEELAAGDEARGGDELAAGGEARGGGADADSGGGGTAVRLNRGLLAFARGNYEGAAQEFDAVLQACPTHCVAANNKAVSLMYGCRLGDAIRTMETGFASAPAAFLQEPFFLNLSSMYELHAASRRDEAKHAVAAWAASHGPEDFDATCLRSA